MWEQLKPWIIPTADNPNTVRKLSAGLTHFRRERNSEYVRYHLRIENSGQALLLVAAVEAVRLTRSGAIAALGILEGKSDEAVLRDLGGMQQGGSIIAAVRKMVAELGLPSKRYPVFNLTDPLVDESPHGLIAPFQADVVLGSWNTAREILEALWDAGIPHVRFVRGDRDRLDEPDVDVLCSAIQFAEDIGMIAGVRMPASQLLMRDSQTDALQGKTVLDRVAELGVDYVVVPWGVSKEQHSRLFGAADFDALQQVISSADRWEITTVFEAALTQQTVDCFEPELDRFRQQGIAHFEVFALAQPPDSMATGEAASDPNESWCSPFEAQHMRQLASWIEDVADERRVQIIWLPSVSLQRRMTDERAAQLVRRGPRAGADISIRIDKEGHVIPPRGPRQTVGLIQRDAWPTIWSHPSFYRFREMVNRNEHCSECTMMTMCAAHCPADPAGWAIEE